jgi:hypothetical protein
VVYLLIAGIPPEKRIILIVTTILGGVIGGFQGWGGPIFDNIRLWDWRALDAVYKQLQEIRLYYEFDDVDVDRYHAADQDLQVMVSAREMEIANLPQQSQTFMNRRFKYTHGYGIRQ